MWKANELRTALAREGQLAADLDAARVRIASLEDQVPCPVVRQTTCRVFHQASLSKPSRCTLASLRPILCREDTGAHILCIANSEGTASWMLLFVIAWADSDKPGNKRRFSPACLVSAEERTLETWPRVSAVIVHHNLQASRLSRAGGVAGADDEAAQMAAERDEARRQLAVAEARTAELQATLDAKARFFNRPLTGRCIRARKSVRAETFSQDT